MLWSTQNGEIYLSNKVLCPGEYFMALGFARGEYYFLDALELFQRDIPSVLDHNDCSKAHGPNWVMQALILDAQLDVLGIWVFGNWVLRGYKSRRSNCSFWIAGIFHVHIWCHVHLKIYDLFILALQGSLCGQLHDNSWIMEPLTSRMYFMRVRASLWMLGASWLNASSFGPLSSTLRRGDNGSRPQWVHKQTCEGLWFLG